MVQPLKAVRHAILGSLMWVLACQLPASCTQFNLPHVCARMPLLGFARMAPVLPFLLRPLADLVWFCDACACARASIIRLAVLSRLLIMTQAALALDPFASGEDVMLFTDAATKRFNTSYYVKVWPACQ